MRRLFQKEWFGIPFATFTTPDPETMADEAFYERFYQAFYRRYASYEDLPEAWRLQKKQVADLIQRSVPAGATLLSIGCGAGYIEHLLAKAGQRVLAVEPSARATLFLRRSGYVTIYHGYFPDCLSGTDVASVDAAFMVGIDYAFDGQGLMRLLRDVREFGCRRLLLASNSITRHRVRQALKEQVKAIASAVGLYARGQFWGYTRTPKELIQSLRQARFSVADHGWLSDDTFFAWAAAERAAD